MNMSAAFEVESLEQAIKLAEFLNVLKRRDPSLRHRLYQDTPERRALRESFRALKGLTIQIQFLKADLTPRDMRCRIPFDEVDETNRYLLVYDLDSLGYRRVCLDNIIRWTVCRFDH